DEDPPAPCCAPLNSGPHIVSGTPAHIHPPVGLELPGPCGKRGAGCDPFNPPPPTPPRGMKRKLYSAVPGRTFMAMKPYQAQAEGELSLSKGEKIKGMLPDAWVLSQGGGTCSECRTGTWGLSPGKGVSPMGWGGTESRSDKAKRLFRHYTVGSYDSFDAPSDYIIKEKTVLLQKKDNEGFGFVLRGAKAQTPIEEFTPTPAFPALQYLESVDEGGVAWRAGLRMGDFLIEVNGQNVVKVGHRQVVNMIRQGGNNLMVKVVMVTRNPEMEEAMRKKGAVSPAPQYLLHTRGRTPGFHPQLWEGSGGWWLEQGGWEPGLLGSIPGSGRGVGSGG
uniref:PDZ domain-containing protein n=1 Tax=Gopherus agassizii TaxID=38772 RepID=A0A452I226_9SAUR